MNARDGAGPGRRYTFVTPRDAGRRDDPGMRRGTLPVLLFLLAAGGTLFLGSRILASERASAERTARERLRARAQEAAGVLVGQALRMLQQLDAGQATAVATPAGRFTEPPEPVPFERLASPRGRDPEADFYLAEGERAEAVDRDPARADGLYRAAAGEGRDPACRAVALCRLAAIQVRCGDDRAARKLLDSMPMESRDSLEPLLLRAEMLPPDDALPPSVLLHVGSPDEVVALGMLFGSSGSRPFDLVQRKEQLRVIERLRPIAREVHVPEGARLVQGRVVVWRKERVNADLLPGKEGKVTFREEPALALSEFVRAAPPDGPRPAEVLLDEKATVGAPFVDTSIVALIPRSAVDAEARRGAWLLGGSLAALLLAGGAAFVLSVRAARRETEAARARADFVTKVGHDLRTPLAVIRMYAETLAAGRVADPAEAREFAAVAAREAERLSGMVGQVLDLSRVGEGATGLARQSLDLAALVAEVAAVHRPLLEHAGVTLTVRAADPLPVLGDSAALRGAVSNLLENAGRHGAAGGSVELEALRDGRMAVVRVLDRGPGIPQGMEERVFERFVRGPGAVGPGAGLGLALVREAAAAHGGTATASNREGGGAVFTLALPVAEEEGA